MFSSWKVEKAIAALVGEAQDLADKLAGAKPHVLDAYTAWAQVWAVTFAAGGVDLVELLNWKPAAAAGFAKSAEARIAALRKAREYDQSDGLSVWLHTARAVSEPRILPPVQEIWARLAQAGPNAASMAEEALVEARLPTGGPRVVPKGLDVE